MKLFVYEGSPKEIAEVARMMGAPTTYPLSSKETGASAEEESDAGDDLTVEQVKLVFERRALAKPVVKMLVLLYKAGEERVSSDTLKEALEYNAHEFRGMLGAFGRRLKNTQGIPRGTKLFDEHWDEELRQKTWTLPTNVRKAVEDLGIVK